MDIRIINVHNHGDAQEEYVLFAVDSDCNLRWYALYDATYNADGTISNRQRHFYKFAPRMVKAGEWVSLRTGVGVDRVVVLDDGRRVHRLFWGLEHPVWNNAGDAAVLMHIAAWRTSLAEG